ncbi:hypothetical protein IDM40_03155 [Nocardiopsis sp. HNM0947]|uniref:Uncharacterized protein n=1 Tax=Nocardiopsis coralli TaxID=2772213 RepID=A0ABR9P1J2_9ACTN|nr:hypothetical protein [Nocardiopsis coralli]MBE2997709.1 hypothetical protein [Nocardiopsis coralli]
MSESTYHQIHFAWAEPTLLGRVGPGPAASSLTESGRPSLRSWRDRLVPALTVDYRSALPGTDPSDLPETLWARSYADGQAALVYRWPGDVRDAHAWAVVGPANGLTLPRILSLHENPNTRPAARRPPVPGWGSMPTLDMPTPWELTAAPGAVRTRDRRAAETTVQGEAVLVGAVASALHAPDRPIRIALEPEHADLWQATQIRVLWGMHRILHDVLTPARAIPAAGWQWSFSTYDPDLATEGQHLAFGPPRPGTDGPYLHTPDPEYRRVAERLVEVLRDEGGDALADHLRDRGVPDAPTFGDRRALLAEWLDPDGAAEVPSSAGVTSAVAAASVGEGDTHLAEAGAGAVSEPGARSTGADASGEAKTHGRPGDDDRVVAGGVRGTGLAADPNPRVRAGTGNGGEAVGEPGQDRSGHDGDTSPADGSPSASGVRGERLPGTDESDGVDIPEAEPLPSDDAADGGGTGAASTATYGRGGSGSGNALDERGQVTEDLVGSGVSGPSEGEPSRGVGAQRERIDAPRPEGATRPDDARDEADRPGAAHHAPETGHGRPGSGSALDERGQGEHDRSEPDTFRPSGGEDRYSGPPPEGESVPRPGAAPSPAHDGSEDVSATGVGLGRDGASSAFANSSGTQNEAADPWPRSAADDPSSALVGQTGHESVGAVSGEDHREEAVGDAEAAGSDRPRPRAYPRSVAGAHPSFRLNRPSDEDDGDPLPEVEDLDAPESARDVRVPVPENGVGGRESPGDAEPTEDARSEGRAPQHPPGSPRPLFGERRPGFAPPAEHPVFGAPEPHDPPSRPTGEPPPLHLPRSHESDLRPRTPDDPAPAPTGPTDPPDPVETTESFEPAAPEPRRSDAGTTRVRSGSRRHAEEAFGGPAREEPPEDDDTYDTDDTDHTDEDGAPHERSPAQAPPLLVAPDGVPAPDYAAETEPETDPDFDDSGANWPTQYADLPLARLERWHAKRGPEGAHTDVVDARAAVRAERSELQRVRDERDHYHAEVQDLRREVARLDRPFLDGDDGPVGADGGRRWPARLLVVVLLVAFLATGLEAGARFGVGALDVLSALPFVP